MSEIEIITNEGCKYCGMAKILLENKNISFKEIKLNIDISKETILDLYPLAKTLPLVIMNGRYIGTYHDLLFKIQEEGENFGKEVLLG